MEKDNDGDIILTDNEIMSIINANTYNLTDEHKVFSQHNNINNINLYKTFKNDLNITNQKNIENRLIEIEHKLSRLTDCVTYIKNKIENIETIFNEFKSSKNFLTKKNYNIVNNTNPFNPFKFDDNYKDNIKENNKKDNDNNKSQINNKENINNNNQNCDNNNNIIKRKYFFILKTKKNNQIGEIYDELKNDEDFINAVFLKEKTNENYYLLIRFKSQKTLDISYLKEIEFVSIGNRTSVALTELTKFCNIICDVKQENLDKETKGYDIVNGLYKLKIK